MTPTPEPTPAVEALRRAWENRRDLGEYAGVPFADMLAAHDAQVAEKAWDEAFFATTKAAPETEWFPEWDDLTNPYRKAAHDA